MRTLFFAPHAGIWVHSFPEALVADALRATGDDIVYVTCDAAFSFCITMASHGLTPESPENERRAICRGCQRDRARLRRGFGFSGYDLGEVLTPSDEARIGAWLASTSASTLGDFRVDGIAVGRATLYEYLIQRKKTQLEVAPEQWPEVRERLGNTLRSLVAAQRVFERETPERLFTYNSLYSVNAMWRAVADQRGVPSYFLHAGSNIAHRLQTMIVARDSPLLWSRRLIAAWPAYRDQPVIANELEAIGDHFEQLFLGTSVFAYSAAKTANALPVRERFGIHPNQKLVVASMSSYDEYVAAAAIGEMPDPSGTLFPTQIDWVRALVDWFASRPDLFLVIRVHPREFPNKREATKSEHALEFESVFATLPANVRVNWPADKLSIYELAEYAEVFLNAWSSAGKEMALLGLPVVVYCPAMLLYPSDLNYVGTTAASYFAAIETALLKGWSLERSRQAFRWWVLELVRSVADIADGYAFEEQAPTSLVARIQRLPVIRQRLDLLRRPARLDAASRIAETVHTAAPTLLDPPRPPSPIADAAEMSVLRLELRRIARALYAGQGDVITPGSLRSKLAAV